MLVAFWVRARRQPKKTSHRIKSKLFSQQIANPQAQVRVIPHHPLQAIALLAIQVTVKQVRTRFLILIYMNIHIYTKYIKFIYNIITTNTPPPPPLLPPLLPPPFPHVSLFILSYLT
uniref:Uncharacterized protein n=1 Tax=Glossina palpalis gambiensis TaxID=67801 RepID=A0A1B0C6Z2_9MUSC